MDAAAFEEAVLTLRSCVPASLDSSNALDTAAAASSQHSPSQQPPQPPHPPRCRPWSEADYFRRLRTFHPQTYFGKPLAAGPPRCAAHGWVNDGVDRLRCEGCQATLTIEAGPGDEVIPDVADPKHHAVVCPWAGQACPREVTQFPLATPEALLTRAGKRFQGCRQLLAQHHGQIGVAVPHDLAALLSSPLCLPLAAVARRLRQEAARAAGREEEEEEGEGGAAAAPSEAEEGAAVLALYGWEAGVLAAPSSSSSAAAAVGWVLGCGLCGRRVEAARLLARRSSASLSPRKGPGGSSPARRTRGGGAPAQAQGEGERGKVEFDPVEQHRYYCPWATVAMEGGEGAAGAEAEAGAEAGWRQLAKVVASRTPRAWFLPGGWDGEGGVDGAVPSQWQLPQKPDDMYNAAMDLLHSF